MLWGKGGQGTIVRRNQRCSQVERNIAVMLVNLPYKMSWSLVLEEHQFPSHWLASMLLQIGVPGSHYYGASHSIGLRNSSDFSKTKGNQRHENYPPLLPFWASANSALDWILLNLHPISHLKSFSNYLVSAFQTANVGFIFFPLLCLFLCFKIALL